MRDVPAIDATTEAPGGRVRGPASAVKSLTVKHIKKAEKVNLPISLEKNSFEDDVHHALYLRPLLLQLEEHEE